MYSLQLVDNLTSKTYFDNNFPERIFSFAVKEDGNDFFAIIDFEIGLRYKKIIPYSV